LTILRIRLTPFSSRRPTTCCFRSTINQPAFSRLKTSTSRLRSEKVWPVTIKA
jgi:hypothetical protein